VQLTIEECFNSHPYELLFTLLDMTNQNFTEAKIQESESLQTLLEMTSGQIDRNVVNEIMDKFFLQNKTQF